MSNRIRKPTFRANLRRRQQQQNDNSINLIPPDVALSFLTHLITPVSDTILSLSLPPPPPATTTTTPPPSDVSSSIQDSMVVLEMSNKNTDDQLIPKLIQEIQDISLVVDDSSFILVNTQVRPYINLIEMAKCHLKNNKISYTTNPTDESHENIIDDDDDIIVID